MATGVSALMLLVGWLVTAPLVAAGLRAVVGPTTRDRLLLIALGWPATMLVGILIPIVLRLNTEAAGLLGVAVAAARPPRRYRAASARPADPLGPRPGRRRGLVCRLALVGCEILAVGLLADRRGALEHARRRDGRRPGAIVLALAAGGVLSGLAGGVLMYLLLRRPAVGSLAG